MGRLKEFFEEIIKDLRSTELPEQLCAHLRSIGIKAELVMTGGQLVRRKPKEALDFVFRLLGPKEVVGRIGLRQQEVDEILVTSYVVEASGGAGSGRKVKYSVNYCVHTPSPRTLPNRSVSAKDLTLANLMRMAQPSPERWGSGPQRGPTGPARAQTVIVAEMIRSKQFLVFGRLREPKWHGGEVARILNQDLALTAMVMRTGLEEIEILVVEPGGMVAISSPFKLPSLFDFEVYNKIAWHVKNM